MISLMKLLLLYFITVLINCKELSTYQIHEFEPSNNEVLYHVTVHNITGDIYIGAHNALYRLSADFMIIANTSTCLPADDCDNNNKVLAIDYDNIRLITCGGGNNGRCEARSLMNLSLDGSEFVEEIVSGLSAVGLIAPALVKDETNEYKKENVLYVSSGHTSLDAVNYYNYVNSRRHLKRTFAQLIDGVRPQGTYINQGKRIDFKAAFSYKDYTYFAAIRPNDENAFLSRLSRVCHSNSFDTLSEVVLRCAPNYTLVQSMSIGPVGSNLATSLDLLAGDNVLYGVFSKDDDTNSGNPTEQSALCVYKLDDIENAFFKALNVCLTGSDTARGNQILNYAAGASCSSNMLSFSAADVMFYMCPNVERNLLRRYSQGNYKQAAVSQAVLTVTDTILTSVIATVEENHTIAFLGTDDGQLMKVNIISNRSAKVYENITLDAGQEVRSDTFLDKSSNQLMVLTENKLVKLPVANCSQFTTCDECVRPTGDQDGDPYCGWCTLEKICTRFKDCQSSSWLPSNTAQCIQITDVEPPFLRYKDENVKVALTVEQLPPLSINENYTCKFGDFVSPGIQNGEMITCTSPPRAQVPQIPTGDAAVEVSLSVHSSQTDVDFVTTQFTFFDCSAITSCSECVSNFTCEWCLYGNTCTYNSSAFCSADDEVIISVADQVIISGNASTTPPPGNMQGQGSCPHIDCQINKELIHASLEKEVRIPVKNLPDASNVNGYRCVLTIEGEKSTIPASVQEPYITCSQYTYDYAADEQELTANIQIVWNDNNYIDNIYEVTLYKCSVQRPDCSRCLSNYTTRPQLDCVWCGDKCLYSLCPTEISDCPAPVITQIMPLSVATVTNQPEPKYTEVIELVGTDFGQTSSDIDTIMIDSKECERIADGFNIASQTVMCGAPVFSTASQRNVIISVQGNSSEPEYIIYQNPSISDINPKFGIKHGGTRVNITGMFLNTGQDLMVSMGESECYIKSVSETQILCTTSHYAVEEEVMVTVTFGQATRDASTFTYTDNPRVADFNPKSSIKAGGRKINVTGIHFQYVQEAKMLVNGVSPETNCEVISNENMSCESPPIKLSSSGQRKRRQAIVALPLTFSFDGFVIELSGESELKVYPNPVYYPFSNETIYGQLVADGHYILESDSRLIQLRGSGIDPGSDSDVSDVEVFVGGIECIVISVTDTAVLAEAPDEEPADANVMIYHGNLEVTFGPLRYPPFDTTILLWSILIVAGVVLIVSIIAGVYYARRIKRFDEQTQKISIEMGLIENQVKEEAQAAIADLTINLQDLSGDDLHNIVIPFVSNRQYIYNMMFTGFEIVPDSSEMDTQEDDGLQSRAVNIFSELLLIKHFLLTFIKVVENSKSTVREKCTFASLLIVGMINEGKMDYFTEVLKELLRDHIEDRVTSHKAKQVLIRTDSVTAKLLSNWIALSMYKYLKDHAARSLYVLYQAIKLRIEMGAVDAVSQNATFSLDLDKSLHTDIAAEVLTLEVILNADSGETQKVKVLSCDTITQVKEKILDSLYRNQPYSARPKSQHLDLNWQHGRSGHLTLSDIDVTSQRSGQMLKLNTIGDLQVMDGCTVALVKKQAIANANFVKDLVSPALTADASQFVFENAAVVPDDEAILSGSAGTEESGLCHYHLEKDLDKTNCDDSKKKKSQKFAKRSFKEIKFPRAVATKEAIQEYVNGMFETVFWASDSQPPNPSSIKYLFDFFDEEAKQHEVDSLTLNGWKNNSLPARFWVLVITHPEFIFDIRQSRPVEGVLEIISRTFLDSCSPKKIQLTKESPINRLLYTKEIPRYRSLVDQFYEKVQKMEFDQSNFVTEIQDSCRDFQGLFSRSSTLQHIFTYVQEHRETVTAALDLDDSYESSHCRSKLKSVFELVNTEPMAQQEMPEAHRKRNQYEGL